LSRMSWSVSGEGNRSSLRLPKPYPFQRSFKPLSGVSGVWTFGSYVKA
jgi:hypothetical protein